jgi:DNA (cytosine-5)-methyltransferase 1
VREYARIQTFPDEWAFAGGIGSQYKQIGNAVPVKLAEAMGRSIIAALDGTSDEKQPQKKLRAFSSRSRSVLA